MENIEQHSFEKQRRLEGRLRQKVDRLDRGEEDAQMRVALDLPAQTAEQTANRLEAVVSLLGRQRLLIPTSIEGQNAGPLVLVTSRTPGQGESQSLAVAFTSLTHLHSWDAQARPTVMSGTKLALTALAVLPRRAQVVINPDKEGVVIPHAALNAIAAGDSWLPAWRDPELLSHLQQIADSLLPGEVLVQTEPAVDAKNHEVMLVVDLCLRHRLDEAKDAFIQTKVGTIIDVLSSDQRLRASADLIQFRPRLCE